MTALREISVHVPPSVPLGSLAEHLGLAPLDVRMYQRLHGLDRVSMATGLAWPEQVLAAATGLTGLAEAAARIRYLIAARSELPVSHTEPFPLREVAAKLGLPDDVICFVIAEHACASGLLAIDLAGRLLARDSDPAALALVLSGEKATAPEVQLIANTTIMSEGSAAVLVAPDGERDRLLAYVSRAGEDLATYDETYHDVFVEALTDAVHAAGLVWDDIKVVLPHNVNKVSWVRIARQLDLPIERFYLDNVAAQAHSFSSDSFINYVDARAAGVFRPGDAYIMAASGIRSVASVMVFRH